jgi:hypothetical protein
LTARERIRILVQAASVQSGQSEPFDDNVYKALARIVHASKLMRGFMEEYVIVCLEESVAGRPKGAFHFVAHVKACFEENVLAEQTIFAWWNTDTTRCECLLVETKVRQRLRRIAKPFMEWLPTDDEPEDDDETTGSEE